MAFLRRSFFAVPAAKVVAANPVFFKWSDDPQAEVRAWWHLKHIKEESKQEYS